MRRILYTLLQFTWGFPQTLLGFLMFLRHFREPHGWFHGAVVTRWQRAGSVSLGLFIFLEKGDEALAVHEYGHTIQSLIWGPLYLVTVGLPSFLWSRLPRFRRKREQEGKSYYAVYPERQASRLGERVTGLRSLD